LPRADQTLEVEAEAIVTVPLELRADPLPVGNGPPTQKELANRILVVEDDASIRQLTTEMLILSGYRVDSASDGAAGWKALQAERYDLLITDNFMPKLTGIEMVKKLQSARMQLPVIMATALFPQEESIRHPWLGSITTLLKPCRAAELLSTVRKILRASEDSY
jgi:DNA-binding response OmpR family regulator